MGSISRQCETAPQQRPLSKAAATPLVPFPFTDQTTAQKRPTVVVSSAGYQRSRPDLVLMAVTSRIKSATGFGDMAIEHWRTAGRIKPSVIKPVFTTVEKTLVIRKMGTFQHSDQETLKMAIRKILG